MPGVSRGTEKDRVLFATFFDTGDGHQQNKIRDWAIGQIGFLTIDDVVVTVADGFRFQMLDVRLRQARNSETGCRKAAANRGRYRSFCSFVPYPYICRRAHN